MKFDCFYKVTVTTCVPESINFFEDEEIWHLGYFPYIEVLKEVEQHYKNGADAVELEMPADAVELEMITQEEFDEGIQTEY